MLVLKSHSKEPEGVLLGFTSRTQSRFMSVFVLEPKGYDILRNTVMSVLRLSSVSGWVVPTQLKCTRKE